MTTLPSPYRATGTYIPRDSGMGEIVWRAPDRYDAALPPWIEAHDLDPKKIKRGGALITDDGFVKLLHVTAYVHDGDGRLRADPVTGEVPTRSVVVPLKLGPPVDSA